MENFLTQIFDNLLEEVNNGLQKAFKRDFREAKIAQMMIECVMKSRGSGKWVSRMQEYNCR